MISILLLTAIAFLLSGLFSGSEMAYLSCNKLKLRHLADQGNLNARQIMRFHRNPKRFLTTILIGNNLMLVTVVGLATYVFRSKLNVTDEYVITAALALPIIIFAETIPKDWFRRKADDFIYRVAPILSFLDWLLAGVSDTLVAVTDFLIRLTTRNLKQNPIITREEFRYVVEESTRGGVLLPHEKQLINTILSLSSVQVRDVMTPIAKFPKVPLTSKVCDVKRVARQTQTDAVLVYEEIPSLVVAILYVFDVLFVEAEDAPLSRFLKAPLFMPQDTSLEKALFLLQSKHASAGVVISPEREVTGVVRLENLVRI